MTDREADLAKRLREMERANRELADRLDTAQSRHDQQMKVLLEQVARLSRKVEAGGSESGRRRRIGGKYCAPSRRERRRGIGRGRRRDAREPEFARTRRRVRTRAPKTKTPLKANFGPGFELMSEDGEFQLQFHQEVQFDAREFDPNGDEFARSGFVIPRAVSSSTAG